jgi:two-component system osmolarity sensor histidine kinase EnvZ
LFGRLVLLLLVATLVSTAASVYLFRQDRAALLARQFGDTKIVQLKALRAALSATGGGEKSATLEKLGEEYQARIVPDGEQRFSSNSPVWPMLVELQERLQAQLGPETEIRMQVRQQLFWIKLRAGDRDYWAGFHLPARPSEDAPSRALEWSVVILVVSLVSAYAFAHFLARPLRELSAAVTRVGQGQSPPPLPENGPSEIANLNRGFNQMLANLNQIEKDRALLLAGVSHDLRTPLARLRLGIEVATRDEQARSGMVEDIEEMDRIIGLFLDFARDDRSVPTEIEDPNAIVASLVERHGRTGKEVHFARGDLPPMPLRPTLVSRMVANLIDNALRYGGSVIDVTTRREGDAAVLEIADRGPGIPPDQVEWLKQPFTRGERARTGATGAGLGLAIVERIARLHGGTFELLPREGGGTLARVTLPLRPAA